MRCRHTVYHSLRVRWVHSAILPRRLPINANPTLDTARMTSTNESSTPTITLAACIIGDEILNGKIQDTNTRYLAKACFERGLSLQKVEVVGDNYADIGESLRSLSGRYDFVLTTGGIGPTHDDITYEAVARTFGRPVAYHQPTLSRMHRISTTLLHTTDEATLTAQKRMALLPSPVQTYYPRADFWVPVAIIKNVYIFPGVPKLFQVMLVRWLDDLVSGNPECMSHETPCPQILEKLAPFHRVAIATFWSESQIARSLADLQNSLGNQAKIGSYPLWKNPRAKVVVTFVGTNMALLTRCAQQICDEIQGFPWTEE
ncbi:hypothetical protein IWQ61_000267 [Dispira simplex]|nr:hypothetical protein IWQ61_000267 [Dispira simplex]